MKKVCLSLLCFFASCVALIAKGPSTDDDISGYWTSIDDKTKKPQSVVAIYEYDGKYYGRIVATYDDDGKVLQETLVDRKSRAPGVKGDPYYIGLDFIWNLKRKGTGYESGKIMDPRNGSIYGCEMWKKGDDLIIRGKYLIFGKNITWIETPDSVFPNGFQKPDIKTFVPVIPKAK